MELCDYICFFMKVHVLIPNRVFLQVINHKNFKGRAEFDEAVHLALIENNIDIVCLAGFMRILTGEILGLKFM